MLVSVPVQGRIVRSRGGRRPRKYVPRAAVRWDHQACDRDRRGNERVTCRARVRVSWAGDGAGRDPPAAGARPVADVDRSGRLRQDPVGDRVRARVANDFQAGVGRRHEPCPAALVARGMTNREIASRLYLSVRTIETHVDHVLTKLGFRTRTQLAARAPTSKEIRSGSVVLRRYGNGRRTNRWPTASCPSPTRSSGCRRCAIPSRRRLGTRRCPGSPAARHTEPDGPAAQPDVGGIALSAYGKHRESPGALWPAAEH